MVNEKFIIGGCATVIRAMELGMTYQLKDKYFQIIEGGLYANGKKVEVGLEKFLQNLIHYYILDVYGNHLIIEDVDYALDFISSQLELVR